MDDTSILAKSKYHNRRSPWTFQNKILEIQFPWFCIKVFVNNIILLSPSLDFVYVSKKMHNQQNVKKMLLDFCVDFIVFVLNAFISLVSFSKLAGRYDK